MIIVKLLPDQVSKLWDSVRYAIMSSIAPIIDPTPENMQTILCQLLKGDMQCWCVYSEGKEIYGYWTTSISVDINTQYRTMILYSLFAYKQWSKEIWDQAYDALDKFAVANDCKRIAAYSSNPTAISVAGRYGFSKDYTYLVKDVGGKNESL